MNNHNNDKQTYAFLRGEVGELLLGVSSPVRTVAELHPVFHEYQELQGRQTELKLFEAKIAEVLPVVEQAEADLAQAEKELVAERKHLASFARELGREVFAGFQSDELLDHPILRLRKEFQARFDAMQQKRASILAEEKPGLLEKAKRQVKQLFLAGQIKVEELKIGTSDRDLGEAIMASKEKLSLKCRQTEQVLNSI